MSADFNSNFVVTAIAKAIGKALGKSPFGDGSVNAQEADIEALASRLGIDFHTARQAYNFDPEAFSKVINSPASFRAQGKLVDLFPTLPLAIREKFTTPYSFNDAVLGSSECFLEGTQIDMWDGSQKPIENIAPDDVVTSYDKDGVLVPGKVKRTFQNRAKHILDVHGLMVTPGHATYCAKVEGEENPFADTHVPIIDILRSDGALAKKDGSLIRSGTGAPVGSIEDRFIWAVTGDRDNNGFVKIREKARIRLGTRHIMPDGEIKCLLNIIGQSGLLITADGLLIDGPSAQTGQPFHWTLTPTIPKPEDYVLQRSAVTLEEIYSAGEWENTKPQMPKPYRGEAGASYVNNTPDSMPPNIPLSMRNHQNQPTMNRQQRRALQRKQAKQVRSTGG